MFRTGSRCAGLVFCPIRPGSTFCIEGQGEKVGFLDLCVVRYPERVSRVTIKGWVAVFEFGAVGNLGR